MKQLPEQVQLRDLRAADVDRVVEIVASLPEAPHWPAEVYRKAAILPRQLPVRAVTVAEFVPTKEIIGCAVVQELHPEAELENLAVERSWQGRGVGQFLLTAVFKDLKERRFEELRLEVRQSNQKAIRLYRRFGAVETGRRPRYYSNPEEDAVLMKADIAGGMARILGSFEPSTG